MSKQISIDKIELNNWYNYMGSYDNTFNFKSKLNVVVGTNNSGKTKLYNAFRYIFEDKVI